MAIPEHHTSKRLDWMAAYREHPLDNIYTRTIENVPALILGFPIEIIAGLKNTLGYIGEEVVYTTRPIVALQSDSYQIDISIVRNTFIKRK